MSKTVVEIRGEERRDGGWDFAKEEFEKAGVEYFYFKQASKKEIFLKSLSKWSGNPADLIAVLLTTESEEAARFLKEFRNLSEETRKKLIIFWTDGSSTTKDFNSFRQRARKTAQKVDFHDFYVTKGDGIYLIRRILNKLEKMFER